jgi:uncharacterized protein YxjI
MMRGRRQDRREERQQDRSFGRRGSGNNRYKMREKLVSIGDDFWIENEAGQKAYKVDGKALRVRKTLIFENPQGQTLCQIQERMMRVKDSMEVEDANGHKVAMVKKALISPVRDRFTVKIKNGPDLEVKGNILDPKKWFRLRDTYGVEIEPGQDDIVILAVTVCIDQMAH